MKTLTLAAALAALLGSSAALAQHVPQPLNDNPPGPAPSTGLAGIVFDPTTGQTALQWFGLTAAEVLPHRFYGSYTFTIDGAATVGDGAGLQYAVVTANPNPTSGLYGGMSVAFTDSNGVNNGVTETIVNIGWQGLAAGFANYLATNITGPTNPFVGAGPGSFSLWGNSLGGNMAGGALSPIGATTGFFLGATRAGFENEDFELVEFTRFGAGTWSTSIVGTNVVFNYSGTAIPLPAAGWLLLSALGGLGFVRRRRPEQV